MLKIEDCLLDSKMAKTEGDYFQVNGCGIKKCNGGYEIMGSYGFYTIDNLKKILIRNS